MSQPIATPPPPPPLPPPGVAAPASGRAVTALVLGILGLCCCGLVAPVAWYLGTVEGRAILAGQSPASGQVMATAAKILGIIGTILMGFAILWILFWGGFAVLQSLANR